MSQLYAIERSSDSLHLPFELFLRGVMTPSTPYSLAYHDPPPALIAELTCMSSLGALPMGNVFDGRTHIRSLQYKSNALTEIGESELSVEKQGGGHNDEGHAFVPAVPNSHSLWLASAVKLLQQQYKDALHDIQELQPKRLPDPPTVTGPLSRTLR
eukprot:GHVO01011300.1.p1 GENE.GHVO01011300.1~~GHVO01011300.1.p1  ORF type:complete len:172 (+),score=39.26 GHVO01011300.1:50-517(+)